MTPYHAALRDFKRAYLAHHLAIGDTVTATARRLGIKREYLCRLKRALGIEGPRNNQSVPRETA